ncbi:DEAD/DEAH box helicase [Aureimonas mangrovi]|uniref:DEAD/DEAH box helicase n=1 Tax=Aureimonas mangrovi TaxID=2758041 RepID=UPI00163D643F|nr:DEAD/DEAH box helicase [Aureimonas mangrovi]
MPFPALPAPLTDALSERGYGEPTPVQAAVTEERTAGRDLLVSAQTGSGKTVAYGLAIAGELMDAGGSLGPASEPVALVVAPTRELALQVRHELDWLYGKAGAQIVTCVGGMDPRAEQRQLQRGAHIVVGTPGRLRDHLERGRLLIGALKALVLDEADEMLNLGFREDLEFILEATPAERRTLLFSATLPKPIVSMTKRYQRDALRIEVAGTGRSHADIDYRAVRIAPNEMEHAVVNVLRYHDAPGAIVFCNTRETVRHLHSSLLERGFSAVALSGELGQNERNSALQSLRDGRARVCVATDVAARGIDLPGLGLVIHAELPNDAETLQHRSGRTGRAGRKGVSVLLVPISRRRKAERLLSEAKIRPEWEGAPTADVIRARDEERLLADPVLFAEPSEEDLATGRALLSGRSAEEIASAFARLYRSRLPAPEDVYDPGFGADPRGVDHGPQEKGARKERGPGGPTVWFKLDIGRRNEADPKWLLPLLCRRGRVTKQEIGAIKIYDRETKFEVAEAAAKKFLAAAEGMDDDITISLADGAPSGDGAGKPRGRPANRSRPPFGAARPPAEGKPRGPFHKNHSGGGRDGGKPRRPKRKA